jgi:hypothetical protein
MVFFSLGKMWFAKIVVSVLRRDTVGSAGVEKQDKKRFVFQVLWFCRDVAEIRQSVNAGHPCCAVGG